MIRILAAGALAPLAAASLAAAQDASASPAYGSVTLESGFSNDPRTVEIQAGGANDVSQTVAPSCAGMVATAPDYSLTYTAGSLPLIISVASASDTTLLINEPDGEWACDDDSGEGMNPSITFNPPKSGRYDIWVGTYSEGDLQSSTLHISEISSQ